MRAVAAVSVLAAVVFGLLAGYSFRAADGALSRAKTNTDQLIRVQAIQNHVVQADADATNAFLVGGLEPAAQRADYTDSISSASKLIAEAAKSQPADGAALGVVNEALVAYASTIEQARANNRQALPIGSQYLKDASAELRAEALPALKNLVDANNARAAEEFDNAGNAALWLVVAGLLTLLVLGLALVWLARRTRRYVNVPLAAAAVIVFVALVVGAIGLFSVGNKVDNVQDGVYAATLSTAQARIAGFDAKSNESLTLIARGSGAAFETAWKAADDVVQRQIRDLGAEPGGRRARPTAVGALHLRAHRHPQARRRRELGTRGRVGHVHGVRLGQRHVLGLRRELGQPSCRRSARTRRPTSTRQAAGCRSPRSWACSPGSSRACSLGGASPSGWRSTGDAQAPRTGRRRHGGDGLAAGRLLVGGRLRGHARPHPEPHALALGEQRPGSPAAPAGSDITTANCLRSYAPDRDPAAHRGRCPRVRTWRRSRNAVG